MCELTAFYVVVPMWAVAAIVVVVLVLVGCFIFCVFKKCFGKKKKPKKVRERKTGRRRKEKEGEGEGGEKVCDLQFSVNSPDVDINLLVEFQSHLGFYFEGR